MGKSWKVIRIDFESKPVYGDDDYKFDYKSNLITILQIFITKKCLKKKHQESAYQ